MTLRSELIQVRVTGAEKDRAKRNAELAGVGSLSEYARAKILGGATQPEKEAKKNKDQLEKLTAIYERRMSHSSAKAKAEKELGLK